MLVSYGEIVVWKKKDYSAKKNRVFVNLERYVDRIFFSKSILDSIVDFTIFSDFFDVWGVYSRDIQSNFDFCRK